MHAQRFHVGFDWEPLYTGLHNSRWPHSPEKDKLEIDVEVERSKMEILLLEPPPPPQDDSSPRKLYAAGTRLDEPGVSHAVTHKMEQEETCPFQADVDGFLQVDCTSPEQEGTY